MEKSSGRLALAEVHSRNSRNLKHNSPTQTDIFSGEGLSARKARSETDEALAYPSERKPFPAASTMHPNSLRPSSELGPPRYPSAFQECCYTRLEPAGPPDCVTVETTLERKHSGGTWPKMVVAGSSSGGGPVPVVTDAPVQLSIFKSPKQRKPIFDDVFKCPADAAATPAPKPPDYRSSPPPPPPPPPPHASSSQLTSHSPQPSKREPPPLPPMPPTRTDSFRFKHKAQGSSASESTITEPKGEERSLSLSLSVSSSSGGGVGVSVPHSFSEAKPLASRKSCEEDIGRLRAEEPEVKRPRPKSAPALRRRMTPQTIAFPSFQV